MPILKGLKKDWFKPWSRNTELFSTMVKVTASDLSFTAALYAVIYTASSQESCYRR